MDNRCDEIIDRVDKLLRITRTDNIKILIEAVLFSKPELRQFGFIVETDGDIIILKSEKYRKWLNGGKS
jgi:hypothetical protein